MEKKKGQQNPCKHDWTPWKTVGYTGDWFHPHIDEKTCKLCGETRQEDH